jgi:glycerol kinase
MRDAVLALDQGTTGSTALVFDAGGRIHGRGYAELPQRYPQPGWVEHDPEDILRITLRAAADALAAASVEDGGVRAIGIANQRETTVVWDRRTGRPVHDAIVWQSRQTAPLCDELRARGVEQAVRARTGLVLDAYFSATKVRWILDRYPEARAAAEAGDVLFGTVDTWLLWRLTGGKVFATEPTNASRTLLYDIHERRWHPELCGTFGVPLAMLPEVRPSRGVLGETVALPGLPAGIPVAGMAGDQQAALFGQGCWEPGTAKNTYGTGCFLVTNMGSRRARSSHGLLTTLCCDGQGLPAYALEGSVFVAGAAVQWLRDEMGLVRTAAETEAVARSVESSQGVYVVPAFAGLGAPYWDMSARGAVLGLTRGAGRAHLVRATLESIAFQTRDLVDAMDKDAGLRMPFLRVDGGAAANDFLMQFQADVLGRPVERPAQLETTAAGAAFLAGLGAGLWQDTAELARVRRTERVFEPSMPEARREELYAGWQDAVRRVRAHG